MPRINSKRKGSSFERLICRKFSKWVCGSGEYEDLFWRTINSGAQRTNEHKKGSTGFRNQSGDMTNISAREEVVWFVDLFSFEHKHVKDLQYDNMVCFKKSIVGEFWKVHIALSEKDGKAPLLICRQNYKPDLLFMSSGVGRRVEHSLIDSGVDFIYLSQQDCYVVLFDEFLEALPFNDFYIIINGFKP